MNPIQEELQRRHQQRQAWKAQIKATFTLIDYKNTVRWKHNGKAKAWQMRKTDALQALGIVDGDWKTGALARSILFELGVCEVRANWLNNHTVFGGLKLIETQPIVVSDC